MLGRRSCGDWLRRFEESYRAQLRYKEHNQPVDDDDKEHNQPADDKEHNQPADDKEHNQPADDNDCPTKLHAGDHRPSSNRCADL